MLEERVLATASVSQLVAKLLYKLTHKLHNEALRLYVCIASEKKPLKLKEILVLVDYISHNTI